MDTAYDTRPVIAPSTDLWAGPAAARDGWTPGLSREDIEQLLSSGLPPACSVRLWSESWELAHVTPASLWGWLQSYGEELAALAVAAGLTEGQLRRHLSDGRRPDRAALEMLADLNCYPYVTPAARPLAA